jgi:hypothetical protein
MPRAPSPINLSARLLLLLLRQINQTRLTAQP